MFPSPEFREGRNETGEKHGGTTECLREILSHPQAAGPRQGRVVLWLNTLFGTLDDPRGLITDVTHIGHHGNGDCQIKIKYNHHMGYIKDLILAHYRNQVQ